MGEPSGRYCPGRAGRNLSIPALRIEPTTYLIAITQDSEQYTQAPAPPVMENVSDAYAITLRAATPLPDFEVEPNDTTKDAGLVAPDGTLKGRLAWMRDVDVVCASSGGGQGRLVVEEDDRHRPRGAALEVTPIGGPNDRIPVRVHPASAQGTVTERDLRGKWQGQPFDVGASEKRCVSLTLVRDVWSEPPLPKVPAASDQTYTVRLERM
jgi:hypothetical protein